MVSITARYVALLRGVNNIGAKRKVSMAELRGLFERMGFRDARTWLNSGNVVFSAQGLGRAEMLARVKKGLAAELGLKSPVIVLSSREVVMAVRDNPFRAASPNPSDLLVVVPAAGRDRARLRPLLKESWKPEALALGSRVAYVWCANSVAESRLWPAVDRAFDRSATARNMRTMTKLMQIVQMRPS